MIKTREAENEQINTERVEKIWNKKLQERQRFKEKLQQAKIKGKGEIAFSKNIFSSFKKIKEEER